MTEMIDFQLEDLADGPLRLRFTLLDSLDQLPECEGLYVLLGHGPQGLRPLAFGTTGNLSRLTKGADFAAALREGFYAAAIARTPRDHAPAGIARALGQHYAAPINTRQEALRAIEAASLPAQLPLAAE